MEGLPTVRVQHPVTDALQSHAQNILGVHLEYRRGPIGMCQHPTIMIDRHVSRFVLVKLVKSTCTHKSVLDIGGFGRDLAQTSNEVHGCTPIIDGSDFSRSRSGCQLKAQECVMQHGPFALWVASHSIYYLTPEDIALITSKMTLKTGFASLHEFPVDDGKFIGCDGKVEAQYRCSDGRVVMTARGNSKAYDHSDMRWLLKTYCDTRYGRLFFDRIRVVGSSNIWRFTLADRSIAPATPAFDIDHAEEHDVSNDVAGLVAIKLMSRDVSPASVDLAVNAAFHAARGKVADSDVSVTAVKAVNKALTWASGRSVSEHLRQYDAVGKINFLRQLAINGLSFWQRLRILLDGWFYLLFGLALIMSVASIYIGEDYFWFATLLIPAIYFWSAVSAAGVAKKPCVTADDLRLQWCPGWYGILFEILLSYLGLGVVNFVFEVIFGQYMVAWFHLLPFSWARALYHALHDYTITIMDVCNDAKELKPIRGGATFTCGTGSCEPRVRLHAWGAIVTSRFPVVARRCWHNERVAIRNRVTMVVPVASAWFWSLAYELVQPILPVGGIVPWAEWLARYTVYKRAHLDEFEITGLRGLGVRPFLKLEKVIKGRDLVLRDNVDPCLECNTELFDPRVISSRSDEYQAYFGPFSYAVSECLKRAWDVNSPVTYASGFSVSDLGSWIMSVEANYPKPHYYCTDFSRFDGHVSKLALSYQYKVMRRVLRRDCPQLVSDYNTSGMFGETGTRYSVVATRKSGNSDTTVGNSVINVGFWLTVLHLLQVDDYRLIVMGDDSVLALPSYVEPSLIEKQLDGSGLSLKLQYAATFRDVTFCSCRFFALPAGGLRAAQVPGRYIAKAGYALDPVLTARFKSGWLKAYTYCLCAEYAHVPVMRALALAFAREYLGAVDYGSLAKLQPVSLEEFGFWHGDIGSAKSVCPLIELSGDPLFDFCNQYGINVCDVQDCERYILSASIVSPFVLRHGVIDAIVEHDL